MDAISQLKHFAKHKFAWPGGYPVFAICSDGAALCHQCVLDNYRIIRESQRDNLRDGWQVSATDINYENPDLYCDHCGDRIESAYCEEL